MICSCELRDRMLTMTICESHSILSVKVSICFHGTTYNNNNHLQCRSNPQPTKQYMRPGVHEISNYAGGSSLRPVLWGTAIGSATLTIHRGDPWTAPRNTPYEGNSASSQASNKSCELWFSCRPSPEKTADPRTLLGTSDRLRKSPNEILQT